MTMILKPYKAYKVSYKKITFKDIQKAFSLKNLLSSFVPYVVQKKAYMKPYMLPYMPYMLKKRLLRKL